MEERSLDWNKVTGKQARGNANLDLGEVKQVGRLYVMVQKGTFVPSTHYLPKYLLKEYNGNTLWFDVSEDQLARFEKEEPPLREDYGKYRPPEGGSMQAAGAEAVIPVLEERLELDRSEVVEEAVIVKEPVVEYRIIEVPVMREELKIVRRPVTVHLGAADAAATQTASSDDARRVRNEKEEGEVRILLKREEVQVTKTPCVFEEVVIRKERVAERKTLSATVIKENVYVQDAGAA